VIKSPLPISSLMDPVIVFGPTGQVGSVAALTASSLGATVWLAMRDTSKSIPGLSQSSEEESRFQRVYADLEKPSTVSQAIHTSSAKRAFIYLVHHATDHLAGAIKAMKDAGIEFVVFLSSFTIYTTQALRDIDQDDLLPYVHAQVEANLEDVFGADAHVAVRPGCFITNLLSEKEGIVKNDVKMYGADFEQDSVDPRDVGRVVGHILVSGPKKGQRKVYVYGPQVRSGYECMFKIGQLLGKDLKITVLGAKEAYNGWIRAGMPLSFANYSVKTLGTKGPDKGNGERFPKYQEGVENVKLYTGKPPVEFDEWVEKNKALFDA